MHCFYLLVKRQLSGLVPNLGQPLSGILPAGALNGLLSSPTQVINGIIASGPLAGTPIASLTSGALNAVGGLTNGLTGTAGNIVGGVGNTLGGAVGGLTGSLGGVTGGLLGGTGLGNLLPLGGLQAGQALPNINVPPLPSSAGDLSLDNTMNQVNQVAGVAAANAPIPNLNGGGGRNEGLSPYLYSTPTGSIIEELPNGNIISIPNTAAASNLLNGLPLSGLTGSAGNIVNSLPLNNGVVGSTAGNVINGAVANGLPAPISGSAGRVIGIVGNSGLSNPNQASGVVGGLTNGLPAGIPHVCNPPFFFSPDVL